MASATAAKRKVVVCGGNGFLGSRICQAAHSKGWEVTSISRSGEPRWASVTSSPEPPPWSKHVNWQKGDMLKPASYSKLLTGADAVVHSMGILLEADYKGVLQGRESPISGLQRAFSKTKSGTQNPLADTSGEEELTPQEKDGQLTYEVMNRDTAVKLASIAAKENVAAFVYISAAGGAPVLPQRYINTKREAEDQIASNFPSMRSIFIRPGMLYDSSRTITMGLAAITGVGATFNSLTGNRLAGLMGAGAVKPLKADTVAAAVVQALEDDSVSGNVEVPSIEQLATAAWRDTMIK